MNSIPDILRYLPHRYPALMVDRVIKVDEESITTLKNVTMNEPHFQGHFPGNPVMPGMFILEALFQSGGLIAGYLMQDKLDEYTSYITTVDKSRFRKPVIPGDQIQCEVTVDSKHGLAWKYTGTAYVEDKIVADAQWMTVAVKVCNNGE